MAPSRGSRFSNTSETADIELSRRETAVRPYLLLIGSAAGLGSPGLERVQLLEGRTEIGRGRPQAGRGVRNLALDHRSVSAVHARVERTTKGFEIMDLDSRNGTFVDGTRIARQPLRDGAIVFFGGYGAVYRLLSGDALSAIEEDLRTPFGPVPTASPAMALAIRKLRRLAGTSESLLVTGETGVGKEVYAQAVHRASGRPGPFVGLNCAAIPTELVESELFGYVRGAHSQATTAKRGLIEEADGGTLFLDELGEMSRVAQTKLLRFLQEREVLPLGSSRGRRVDARVVAATASVETLQDQPALRRDLMMRLGSQPIVLPPLRERPEDVGALFHHFAGAAPTAFENTAFLALCLHDWPGNVRELEKVVQEALILGGGDRRIGLDHLPDRLANRLTGPPTTTIQRRAPRPAPSRAELEGLLARHKGHVAEVARVLDRRWPVVWRWMKQHALDPNDFRMPT